MAQKFEASQAMFEKNDGLFDAVGKLGMDALGSFKENSEDASVSFKQNAVEGDVVEGDVVEGDVVEDTCKSKRVLLLLEELQFVRHRSQNWSVDPFLARSVRGARKFNSNAPGGVARLAPLVSLTPTLFPCTSPFHFSALCIVHMYIQYGESSAICHRWIVQH